MHTVETNDGIVHLLPSYYCIILVALKLCLKNVLLFKMLLSQWWKI